MKLTKVQKKLHNSIFDSIQLKYYIEISNLASFGITCKIDNEIKTPNNESISITKIRMLNNLKNEIN